MVATSAPALGCDDCRRRRRLDRRGFLPDLADDLRVTTGAAGLSVTVFACAYAVGAPVWAAATNARRPRTVLIGALVLLAAANLMCAVSASFPAFLVGRVLAAFAASVVTPAAGVLAARVADPSHRGRALALVIAGLTIATAVGVPAGSVLARVGSWRDALTAVAVLAVAAAVTIRATAPDPDPGVRLNLSRRLAPLTDHRVIAILGLTVVGMSAAYVPYAYTAHLLPRGHDGWIAVTLASYGVGAIAGSLASGHLTDAYGSRRTLTIAYVTMTVAFLVFATAPSAPVVAVTAMAWGAASWMQTPAQQHRLLLTHTDNAPVTIGANASALYAGIALGNTLGGVLLDHGSQVLALAAVANALVALGWNTALTGTSAHPVTPTGVSVRGRERGR